MSPEKAALVEALLVERYTRWETPPLAPVDAATARRHQLELLSAEDEHRPLWLVHDATRRSA